MGLAGRSIIEGDKKVRSLRSVMPQRADELSDEQLMKRLARPEVEAALSALYDRYSRTAFGIGLKLLEAVMDSSLSRRSLGVGKGTRRLRSVGQPPWPTVARSP
jgi:hypothetical protein